MLDIRDFGAIGDNSFDCATAINAAIAAAPTAGGVVYIPTGTYVTTDPLVISDSAVRIFGDGASSVIACSLTTDEACFEASGLDDLVIERLKITGTCAYGIHFTTITRFAIRDCQISGATVTPASDACAGISLMGCINGEVSRNILSANGGATQTDASLDIALRESATRGCKYVQVLDNSCTSSVTMNISVENSNYCQVQRNYCSGAKVRSSTDPVHNETEWGYGIYQYAEPHPTEYNKICFNYVENTEGTGIYNIAAAYSEIIGNTLNGVCSKQHGGDLARGGITFAAFLTTGHGDAIIANNQIRNISPSVAVDHQSAIYVGSPRCVIQGNVIQSVPFGIMLGTDGGTGAAANAARICGNVIESATNKGIGYHATGADLQNVVIDANCVTSCDRGIHIDSWHQLTITANTVRNSNYDGINVANCDQVVIADNQSYDNDQGSHSAAGIYVLSCTDVTVTGNRSNNLGAGTTQDYGMVLNSVSGLVFRANALAGTTAANRLILAGLSLPIDMTDYLEVEILNGAIKTLRATAVTLVPAPNSGAKLVFLNAALNLDASSGAYTESGDNLAILYAAGTQASDTIETTGFVDQSAKMHTTARPALNEIGNDSAISNQALVLKNIGAAEFGAGNGANKMRVCVDYRVIAILT